MALSCRYHVVMMYIFYLSYSCVAVIESYIWHDLFMTHACDKTLPCLCSVCIYSITYVSQANSLCIPSASLRRVSPWKHDIFDDIHDDINETCHIWHTSLHVWVVKISRICVRGIFWAPGDSRGLALAWRGRFFWVIWIFFMSYMNITRHTWVITHLRMSLVTIRMSHVTLTHKQRFQFDARWAPHCCHAPRGTRGAWVMLHLRMSHVTLTNDSFHHTNESYHAYK